MYLIIWILFGIGAAIAASNKGRSGFGWFLLGVLLGPFGLIFALLVPAIKPEVELKETSTGEERRPCPYCAEPIKKSARKCRWCGSAVEPLKEHSCHYCNHLHEEGTEICEKCGQNIDGPPFREVTLNWRPWNWRSLSYFLAGLIVLIVFFLLLYR